LKQKKISKKNRLASLLLIIGFLWGNQVFSQNTFENYQFRIVDQKASKSGIYTIAQDQLGFMWMGTNGAGLYKYDGVNYITYEQNSKDKNSVNSNLIYATYVDKENRLWVGTDDGLCLYSRDLDNFETINLQKYFKNKNVVSVKCIIEDENGNIFLGTLGNGLLKLNIKSRQLTKVKTDVSLSPSYLINCLVKDKKGKIFLGTSLGLQTYDAIKNKVVKVDIGKENEIISGSIVSLFFDTKQNLWIGNGYKGLLKLDLYSKGKQVTSFPITTKRIMAILATDEKNILCATENDGLIIVNAQGIVQKKYVNSKFDIRSISSNSIWSLYFDKDKRVWLGYYNKGLGVFDEINSKVNVYESLVGNPQSLQTNCVTSVAKDDEGQLWIAMEGGGVDVYNLKSKVFNHINKNNSSFCSGLTNDNITKVFIDKKQNIWLCSWNEGIFFLKKGSRKLVNYNTRNSPGLTSDHIMDIAEDSRGIIWIGTFSRGLHYYNPANGQFYYCNAKPFHNNDELNSDIRKVMVDSDDCVWVGSTTGLFKISTNDFVSFSVISFRDKMSQKLKNHKSIHTINTIYEAKNKEIWIGTDGAGLFSYNKKTDVLQWYINYKGLYEKSIAAIVQANDGSLWLSGKKGITKIDLKNKSTINYSTDDGLLGNDFNDNAVLKDEKGLLYFGSYEGLNYFNPANLIKSRKVLPVYLTDFKLFNKSVNPNDPDSPLKKVISETESITLNYDQSVFTIDFIGLNFSFPAKNEYAYYLEGFEDAWNYVGSKSSATYTNLAPGKYVFKVKASEKNGVWNKTPLELKIIILPPWWKTSLAYLFYLLFVITVIYFINKYYQNRFKEKQMVQFEKEKVIQVEKLNNKKLQFFTNISHEFRTPLTLIINPLVDIIKNNDLDLPKEVLNKLHIIHKSSDRLSRLINELMDFDKLQFNKMTLHVQQIEVVSFSRNVVSYFEEEASSRSINMKFESDVETLYDWLDPKMIEKIIFNIISNAFKVTADNGTICIRINAKHKLSNLPLADGLNDVEAFEIAIQDTGAGLNKKEIKRIFDRFYQVNNLNKIYYGSTGIGLEVVRSFVELHKGKIEVDSELGVGTTFTVVFPLGSEYYKDSEILEDEYKITAPEKKESEAKQKVDIVNEIPEREKVHTILIVEDNTELRNYLKDELKKIYKVIEAENGKKGFELAKKKLPDLILTDVIMPVMNGLELCKNVKADIQTSHIPLLMLSAKALVQDKLEGIDSGADMYMSKPFDMDILKSSLSQLINSRQIMFDKFYKGITNNAKEKTTTLDNDFIQKVLNYIHENISEPELSVEVIASKVFLSRSQLYRKLKTLTGVSVNEFIRNVRLEKGKELIKLGNNNINEISYKVGFTSASYFTKCYKAKYGHLPTQMEKETADSD
jgi:signal transduction histidine kinase/ligand-binding sensor domain-containing protein/DNA-binding response OmpR family regulator